MALRHPDAVAIRQQDRAYTYRELSVAAIRTANWLAENGLRIGEPVSVSGASSFGLIAAALGVLLSGGVLVFIDDHLPSVRKEQISGLVEARLTISVVHEIVESRNVGALVVEQWPDHGLLAQTPSYEAPRLPDDASAYIFFTSGSSGVPKGVLGSHNGLAHFLDWQRSEFPIGPGDRAAQITALSFDVVLRDLFFPLTSGATIDIPEREIIFNAARFREWVADRRITILHSVPSLMKAWLMAAGHGQPFSTLRYAFFAGEPLTDYLVRRFRAAAGPKTNIVNLYGPTETTLAKLFNRIAEPESGVQLIGRPQPGVQVMILRDRSQLCAAGEVGEIAIRTPYRSHGYYRNEDLTRQAFISNPFGTDPDDLVYCTGDLGCLETDGRVRIFGRLDSQIKIRGVRIEPNEIEAAILHHPAIRDAVVTTRSQGNDDSDKVLLACVVTRDPVPEGDAHAFSRALREFLQTRLQEAMVPSRIIILPELPHLPNGKLDRKAVAALELGREAIAHPQGDKDRPTDPRRLVLLTGLEQTLGTTVYDLDQSFIELGGDSLSFITASMIIENQLGYLPDGWENIPLRQLLASCDENKVVTSATGAGFSRIQMPILLRALSIIFIVLGHAGAAFVVSTQVLFLVSGMSFVRFILPNVLTKRSFMPSVRFILRYGIPAALWILLRAVYKQKIWLPDVFLFGTLWQPADDPHFNFWFLDILSVSVLMVTGLALICQAIRGRIGGKPQPEDLLPFLLVTLLISALLFAMQVGTGIWDGRLGESSTGPFRWFWMFVLGGIIQTCLDTRRRGVALAAFAAMTLVDGLLQSTYLIPEYPLELFPYGVLLLIFFRNAFVPTVLRPLISLIASSSLFIYIINMGILGHLPEVVGMDPDRMSWPLHVSVAWSVFALVNGVIFAKVWNFGFDRAPYWLAKIREAAASGRTGSVARR